MTIMQSDSDSGTKPETLKYLAHWLLVSHSTLSINNIFHSLITANTMPLGGIKILLFKWTDQTSEQIIKQIRD